ncbi:glycosyltransferase family 2 protein [Candidatus Contubernalis alkaliaceticus]|uniref:glycosyltransferase family 2 protein n=1 Tax=Candidatus Contubernalis alkaliaceticus TaxID=338645 RepID=UPI001F4BD1CD|nr:glycosyltransferase family 2 protein [Candidatus Contubernalis alkalaceticus]UNC93475.1 glycosyltransferase [Candidatus Contubernalis alkalaceticus]
MHELITIIVPIYKCEKYIRKCIDSIVNQTYKNLEIILVNDGSPDKCGEICDHYSKIDKRFKVIHKENGGISDARNTGLNAARGKYISFADCDDYLHPKMLEVLWQLITTHNADISICDYLKTYPNDSVEVVEQEKAIKVYSNIEALHILFTELPLHEDLAWNVPWNKLYLSKLFNEFRFPKGRVYEDVATIYKLLHKSRKIVKTNKPLYYYLQRDDSVTKSQQHRIFSLDILDACSESADYFLQHGLIDLYEITAHEYMKTIIRVYHQLRDSDNSNNEALKSIKKRYNTELKRLKILKKLPLQKKMDLYIFYIHPQLLVIWDNRRKRKSFKSFLRSMKRRLLNLCSR